MVQKGVQDDLLRYHKTLLVWTNKIQNHEDLKFEKQKSSNDQNQTRQSDQNKHQLKQVRKCLIETLNQYKTGVSLAQLPQHLKRKLNFELNLNNLGYPKFKDLILSMNDVI